MFRDHHRPVYQSWGLSTGGHVCPLPDVTLSVKAKLARMTENGVS